MSLREARPPGQYPTLPAGGDRRTPWAFRESGPPEPPRPRLLDRVRQALRARHLSRRTEAVYVAWIRRIIVFHDKRHSAEMGAPETPRSQRRQHDTDLHPRLEPGPGRRPKPGRPYPRPMTRLPLGQRGASSGATRQFRRARTASALRQGTTWRGVSPIRGIGDQPHRASIPQRALRHPFLMVPSNSRWADSQ